MVTLKGKETELAAGSKLRAVSTVANLAEKSPDSDNALKVLPQGSKPWYRTWHLVKLNLILMVPLVSSASVGYDGLSSCSLMDLKLFLTAIVFAGSMMNFCTEILTVIIPLLKIETSVLVSLKAR